MKKSAARQQNRRKPAEIVPLPFVSPSGNNWWSVKPTGHGPVDREAGIAYAWQYLDHVLSHYIEYGRQVVPTGFADRMMRDMIRSRDESAMATGFLEGLLLVCIPLLTHETIAKARTREAQREATYRACAAQQESLREAEKGPAAAQEA